MAGNMQDKNTAFQATESALTSGENWLRPLTAMPIFDPLVTDDGLHRQSATATPVWDATTGVWGGTDVVDYTELPGSAAPPSGQLLSNVSQQPQYLIEDMGPIRDPLGSLKLGTPSRSTRNVFRVTALGSGRSVQAVVMSSPYSRNSSKLMKGNRSCRRRCAYQFRAYARARMDAAHRYHSWE